MVMKQQKKWGAAYSWNNCGTITANSRSSVLKNAMEWKKHKPPNFNKILTKKQNSSNSWSNFWRWDFQIQKGSLFIRISAGSRTERVTRWQTSGNGVACVDEREFRVFFPKISNIHTFNFGSRTERVTSWQTSGNGNLAEPPGLVR